MSETSDDQLPTPTAVRSACATFAGVPATEVTVHSVTDLSPRLGSAVVLRVIVEWDRHAPGGGRRELVVKVPGWGAQSLLDSRDPLLDGREVRFLRGDIPNLLPKGLSVPPDAVVVSDGGREWIFMRDIAASLNRPWTPESAGVAAVRAALLYAPGASDPALLDTPWLERHGFAAYRHHVEAGHENLEAISGDTRLDGLFSSDEIRRLHGFLDQTDKLIARADGLPPTLVHGDLHVLNAGLGADQELLLIDWEHVGVGPPGYDLATFVSVYRLFNGRGELDEPALVQDYGQALSAVAGADLVTEARIGYAITHLTWGLHLRLGPGLTAVRQGSHGDTPEELRPHLADIRSGCARALSLAPILDTTPDRSLGTVSDIESGARP
jgi:hypothetical protein